MAKNEKEKWEKYKSEKLKKEHEKIIAKNDNEKNFLNKKAQLQFTEFKKNRALETEK